MRKKKHQNLYYAKQCCFTITDQNIDIKKRELSDFVDWVWKYARAQIMAKFPQGQLPKY